MTLQALLDELTAFYESEIAMSIRLGREYVSFASPLTDYALNWRGYNEEVASEPGPTVDSEDKAVEPYCG